MTPDRPQVEGQFESEVRDLVARVLDGVLDGPTPGDPGTVVGGSAVPDNPVGGSRLTHGGESAEHGGQRIAIGADHGGFALKQTVISKLIEAGWDVDDCGTNSAEACDYPEFAHAVARQVSKGNSAWGIMIDGAGIGSAMVANKVPGVRAAACYDLSTARNSREHNRANVLTLGAGLTGAALAWQIVQEWLATPWGGDRHLRRVALINEIEEIYARSES
ncbi:MAG: ribose 5-phosphate isomerase B [Acidimicrobiales bacterium]